MGTPELLTVSETFVSIQGESTLAGIPCAFIRLTGCNLRCRYCDTAFAWEGGTETGIEDLVGWAERSGVGFVEITGGEPLLQENTGRLAGRLLEKGFRVAVETNGSVSLADLPSGAMIVMDVKTPGSGEEGSMDRCNLGRLRPGDNLKFVITSRADYAWALGMVRRDKLHGICEVLFSPAFGYLPAASLADWILEDRAPVRFQLQLHKILWPERERGV